MNTILTSHPSANPYTKETEEVVREFLTSQGWGHAPRTLDAMVEASTLLLQNVGWIRKDLHHAMEKVNPSYLGPRVDLPTHATTSLRTKGLIDFYVHGQGMEKRAAESIVIDSSVLEEKVFEFLSSKISKVKAEAEVEVKVEVPKKIVTAVFDEQDVRGFLHAHCRNSLDIGDPVIFRDWVTPNYRLRDGKSISAICASCLIKELDYELEIIEEVRK